MEAILLEPIVGLIAAQQHLDEQRLLYIQDNICRIETFTIGTETIRVPRLTLVHSGAIEIRSAHIEMNLRTTRLTRLPVLAKSSNGAARASVSMSLGTSTINPQLERLIMATSNTLV